MERRTFLGLGVAAGLSTAAAGFPHLVQGAGMARRHPKTTTPTTTSPAPTTAPVTGSWTPTVIHPTSGQKVTLAGRSWVVQSPDKTYSMAVDPDPAPNYLRVEMRQDDKWLAGDGRARCELNSAPTAMPWNVPVWASYSFRQTGTLPDSWTIINQWHQRPDSADMQGKSPCMAVQFVSGDIKIYTRGDPAPATTTVRSSTDRFRRAWDDTEHGWHHLVLNPTFHWSNGSLRAWLDGQQIVNVSGISLGYNDPYGPSPKLGIYRQNAAATTVIQFANVELGTTSLSDRIAHPLPVPAAT